LGSRSETAASFALPGNTWRLKYQGKEPLGKDSFLEFKEDGSLVEKRSSGPGTWGWGDIGQYKIISRDEIMIEISPATKWRVGGGRFAVVLAGDNVVLENRINSDRVFLHRLTQASDEPGQQVLPISQEESMRRNTEESRHNEMMSVLRQIAAKK
jgi:hypothetical protein